MSTVKVEVLVADRPVVITVTEQHAREIAALLGRCVSGNAYPVYEALRAAGLAGWYEPVDRDGNQIRHIHLQPSDTGR